MPPARQPLGIRGVRYKKSAYEKLPKYNEQVAAFSFDESLVDDKNTFLYMALHQ